MFRMVIAFIALAVGLPLQAGEVEIEMVEMTATGKTWRASVTLEHEDSGWDHYADAWRLVDKDGNELGIRILAHPHVDEQPFTRSLGGIKIPEEVPIIIVEARDTVHGWSRDKIRVDLNKKSGDGYKVQR